MSTPLVSSGQQASSLSGGPLSCDRPIANCLSHDLPQQLKEEVDSSNNEIKSYTFQFDVELCFRIIGLTTILAFILIIIPLGYDDEMNDWLFVLSQIIYCWLAFNLTRYMFEFTTPGLSLLLHYGIFCCATISVISFYVLYFNQIREDGNLGT